MEKLFGLEMAAIAGALSAILVLVIVSLALLAWRRPVFLKLGLRPIPRRRAQSTLIVLGLMLATLIITAAFVTGDTLSHSIRSVAIEGMGEIDEAGPGQRWEREIRPISEWRATSRWRQQLAGYPLVDRLLPAINESAPVVNVTRRSSLRSIEIMGLRPEDIWVLPQGEITDAAGQPLSLEALEAKEVYLNAAAAEALDAAPGDTLELYVGSHPKDFTVRAIAGQGEEPRMLVTLRQAQRMFNQHGQDQHDRCLQPGRCAGRRGAQPGGNRSPARSVERSQGGRTALRLSGARSCRGRGAADGGGARGGQHAAQTCWPWPMAWKPASLSPATRSLLADEGLANRVQSILSRRRLGQ